MTDVKQVLCIGGKHDGRRVAVNRRPVVHLVDPLPVQVAPWTEPICDVATVTNSVYLIEILRAGDRDFHVGRPPDQSLESTMALLFQGYRGT